MTTTTRHQLLRRPAFLAITMLLTAIMDTLHFSSSFVVKPLFSRPPRCRGQQASASKAGQPSKYDNNYDGLSPPSPPPPPPTGRSFRRGDKVFAEVTSFGPLGASVDIVGIGHDEKCILPGDAKPLGRGLIIQSEIHYFRQLRNLDVVRGEVLQAFVQDVRENGDLAIGLRSFGGRAKAQEVGDMILDRLQESQDGTLPIGDKSTPEEIGKIFPGVSKVAFKKALGGLFKDGRVKPSPNSISLMRR